MRAKEYLSQAIWLDKVINNKIEQQESIRALAERVTVDFSKERVSGGSSSTSPMEDATVKLIDLSNEINEYIDRFIYLKREIQDTINGVGDMRYKLILELRYINNKSWDDVSRDIGFDKRYTMKLHGRALNEVNEILKLTTKRHLLDLPKGDII